MKYVLALCIALCVASASRGADVGSLNVSSNASTLLLPGVMARGALEAVTPWATTAVYAVGATVAVGGSPYACVIAGTSSNEAPIRTTGGDLTDNDITWRPVPMSPRKGLSLYNAGPSTVYLSFGTPAVSEAGLALPIAGSLVLSGADAVQDAVHAVSASNSAVYTLSW